MDEYSNSKGIRTSQLNFTHGEQKNKEQLISLKKKLVLYVESIVGGILICFPSYILMDLAYDTWKDKIGEYEYFHDRRIFKETKDILYKLKVMEDYKREIRAGRGAVLLIVFRGNYSEGYNFSDDLCRAMIIVGQPFPKIDAPKLKLKEKLLGKKAFDRFCFRKMK